VTTYSKADLASKALRQPGLYAPDEAISGEDQADAEEVASALVETLASQNIYIPNGSVSQVPEAWYIPLARYIGLHLMESFGGGSPSADVLEGALSPLRVLSAKPETGSVLETTYY
jgi:hypothetical protein